MANLEVLDKLLNELKPFGATLVAVSKTRGEEEVRQVIEHGHLNFGENYVQELVTKQQALPTAHWHFIGHLQSNKVKQIASFVSLIHAVDSFALANVISKEAVKYQRSVDILLQVHIATEETKYGLSPVEVSILAEELHKNPLPGLRLRGLMGMASLTNDEKQIAGEFKTLRKLYDSLNTYADFNILSMGMSSDYKIAVAEGSTMVRIGSMIFGVRSNDIGH